MYVYEKEDVFKKVTVSTESEIMSFIKNDLGLSFEKVNDAYKGKAWARWKITFTKKGKLVMQARSVRKSFEINTGYDIYKIFTGFEII